MITVVEAYLRDWSWITALLLSLVCASLGYIVFYMHRRSRSSSSLANSSLDLSRIERLNVVITGGSRGIGYALAREFCSHGHCVIICGRDEQRLYAAVDSIRRELATSSTTSTTSSSQQTPLIHGTVCDISSETSLQLFASFVQKTIVGQGDGSVHVWINNAGVSTPVNRPLHELSVDQIEQVVSVNMLGTILSTRTAIKLLLNQPSGSGGHLFNMEGAGSRGSATPNMSVYGCTKAGITQFTLSVRQELSQHRTIGVHLLSPGMVITDLLVKSGTSLRSKRFFNILAEEPHVVATYLYDRIRNVSGTGTRIAFLTPLSVLYRFATFFTRRNRFFDNRTGEPTYR